MHLRYLGFTLLFLLASSLAQAGAWGYKSFENDDALDWVENYLKRGGPAAVERTITTVAKGKGYLEAPEASYAIAACEVLAAAQGRPSPDLPEDVAALAKRMPAKVSDVVRKNARDALDRILKDESELRELWQDAGEDFAAWKKSVEDLKTRV